MPCIPALPEALLLLPLFTVARAQYKYYTAITYGLDKDGLKCIERFDDGDGSTSISRRIALAAHDPNLTQSNLDDNATAR